MKIIWGNELSLLCMYEKHVLCCSPCPRSRFSSLILLACLYLLWASLWSALLCSSVWHSTLLCWGEVSVGTVAFSIINLAELAYFEMCAYPYAHALICFNSLPTEIITHQHYIMRSTLLSYDREESCWAWKPQYFQMTTKILPPENTRYTVGHYILYRLYNGQVHTYVVNQGYHWTCMT